MSLRINPNYYSDLITSLSSLRGQESRSLQQLATGMRINSISDEPAAVADLVINRSQSSQNDQYVKNIQNLRGSFQISDSTLNSVVTLLSRAGSLGTEGANGTLTDANRQAIAVEVRGIQQQLVGLGNTTYQGKYLFGGTEVTQPPFVLDQNTGVVTYQGNNNSNSIQVGEGDFVPSGISGAQLFTPTGADVFQAVNSLATALETNGDVATATTDVHKAFDKFTAQRSFFGNSMNRLNTTEQFLSSESIRLKSNLNDIAGADLSKVASDLSQIEVAKNATLQATAKISQLSLFDYLK